MKKNNRNILSVIGILGGAVAALLMLYLEYFGQTSTIFLEPSGQSGISAALVVETPISTLIRRVAFYLGYGSIILGIVSLAKKENATLALGALVFGLSPIFATIFGAVLMSLILIFLSIAIGVRFWVQQQQRKT